MLVQKSWDEYEVALLIEAYFEIKKDHKRKKEILTDLSKKSKTTCHQYGFDN